LLEHLTVRVHHHETSCHSELFLLAEGREYLLHYIAEVKQWRDFYDKDHKSEKQQRKEYYPLHIAAANDKTISNTERSKLEKKYKGALVSKNAEEKIKKTQDLKEFPAYENIDKAICSFMKNKRGPAERTFEEMIATSPISAHHNPWHGGTLNGNDIERLLESMEWGFPTLKSLTTTDEKISKELSEIEEVWDFFANIVPLLHSTRLIEITERADLISYIEEFGELFKKNTTNNPTPKMHSLSPHVEACFKKYDTVGLFAEYSLEVIHALVNHIVAGSPDKTGTSFFVGREYSHHETLEERNGKKRGDDCPRREKLVTMTCANGATARISWDHDATWGLTLR
jgi:hypothetical protein